MKCLHVVNYMHKIEFIITYSTYYCTEATYENRVSKETDKMRHVETKDGPYLEADSSHARQTPRLCLA